MIADPNGGIDLALASKVIKTINPSIELKMTYDPALLVQYSQAKGLKIDKLKITDLKNPAAFLDIPV